MKLDLILENVRNKYTMGLLQESELPEKELLQGKILINESTMHIRKMLIDDRLMESTQAILEEAFTNIIEESLTEAQRQAYDNTNVASERLAVAAGGIPVAGGIASSVGQMHGGYNAGGKLGHQVAGTFMGREGALGATSMDPNSQITVGDAYSKDNMLTRAIGGASSGALAGGMIGGIPGAAAGAVVGGVTMPLLTPGARYGLGKVFAGQSSLPVTK